MLPLDCFASLAMTCTSYLATRKSPSPSYKSWRCSPS
jgi:hypothetical protein